MAQAHQHAFVQPANAPVHGTTDACPLCDQPIPHNRAEEVRARIEARRSAQSAEIAAQLKDRFEREKREAVEGVQRQAATDAASQISRARDEERQKVEAIMNVRLAQVEAAKVAAEQSIETIRQEASTKEAAIRAEVQKQVMAAAEEKVASLQREREQAETVSQQRIKASEEAKALAEQNAKDLLKQLEKQRTDNHTALQKITADAEVRVSAARLEAATAAQTSFREQIATAERAKAEAEAKRLAAEQEARALKETQATQLEQRLQEVRTAMERERTAAVNAEKSAAFEREQKLSNKVDELQRTIANKTAEELGEGAEIDLFEDLKREFEGDKIERINRGQPGADILHVVIHNNRECGRIIYDSKNHNAWRNDFVTKLSADQMAAKADHAILASRKFPAGTRQLCVVDGVVVAAPARVLALAHIVRQHLVETHALRLSDQARTQKTAALYAFITSQRCADLLGRIDTHSEDLLELQAKEKRAHDATWKRQGELIRATQKVRAEITNEIDLIVGTADKHEHASNE
jgi:hypothetical protein